MGGWGLSSQVVGDGMAELWSSQLGLRSRSFSEVPVEVGSLLSCRLGGSSQQPGQSLGSGPVAQNLLCLLPFYPGDFEGSVMG